MRTMMKRTMRRFSAPLVWVLLAHLCCITTSDPQSLRYSIQPHIEALLDLQTTPTASFDTPSSDHPNLPSTIASFDTSSTAVGGPLLPSEQTHIVNGETAARQEFPYFVRVDYYGELNCGGVLIYPDVVLTAGHCWEYDGLSVVVNAYHQDSQLETAGQVYRRTVIDKVRHPLYNGRTIQYDFLLLKLDAPIHEIEPVALNDNPTIPEQGTELTMIGLGAVRENGPSAHQLQSVTLRAESHAECSAHQPDVDETTMFCAYTPSKDTCSGDSGGPAIYFDSQQNKHVVVGITSWGIGCARPDSPGVYARVSVARAWIQSTLCTLSDVPPSNCGAPILPASQCDDQPEALFAVDPHLRNCHWLTQQSLEQQSTLCQPGHPSGARGVCRETCSVCQDFCQDADETVLVSFSVRATQKTCGWLRAQPRSIQNAECVPDRPAWGACRETCESCWNSLPYEERPTLPPTPLPTVEPTPSPTTLPPTPRPTPLPTVAPTPSPTLAPTPEPTVAPTLAPTPRPTNQPTQQPTPGATTLLPTPRPTNQPTQPPTVAPTLPPTLAPAPTPTITAPLDSNDNNLPKVTSFVLVNADTDTPLQILEDGQEFVFSEIPSHINIEARTEGTVGSVVFFVNGTKVRTENMAPYAIGGDSEGNWNSWTPTFWGPQTVTAVLYDQADGNGNIVGQGGSIELILSESTIYSPPPREEAPSAAPTATTASQDAANPNFRENCNDDPVASFRINERYGSKGCAWLKSRKMWQRAFCRVDHPSNAYNLCEETCGKCVDACDDSKGRFSVPGRGSYRCSWLTQRSSAIKSRLCAAPDGPAYLACPETCGSCGGAPGNPDPTAALADSFGSNRPGGAARNYRQRKRLRGPS